MDNTYYRYLRRLEAWALEINAFGDINETTVNVGMSHATARNAAKTKSALNLEYNEGQSSYVPKDTAILMAVSSNRHSYSASWQKP